MIDTKNNTVFQKQVEKQAQEIVEKVKETEKFETIQQCVDTIENDDNDDTDTVDIDDESESESESMSIDVENTNDIINVRGIGAKTGQIERAKNINTIEE
eukprot:UN07299